LNKGSESEQPTRPVDLRDGGVDIDLPSREEIEEALEYLKNNKAAGAYSIAAEGGRGGIVSSVQELDCNSIVGAKNSIVKTIEGIAS
jgi:hypothetical protein